MWEEILQTDPRGLPTKEVDEGREVIPSEGEGDSPAHQTFEEALFGWSWVLQDFGESLPLIDERRPELAVSVIYLYLFQHFCSTVYHITFQFFITIWSLFEFSLINFFFHYWPWANLREVAELKCYAAHLEQEGI